MAAGKTYIRIASNTLSSNTNSVTFNNIPQNFTDLVLVFTGTCNTSADNIVLRYNNDSSTVYSLTTLYGRSEGGGPAGSARATGQVTAYGNLYTAFTSGQRSMSVVNIQNYSNSTTFKNTLVRAMTSPGNSAFSGNEIIVNLWRNTSPITSIQVIAQTLNFTSGSTFTLYGIECAKNPYAEGGDKVYTTGTHWVHEFYNSGLFVPRQNLTADYLVVAGGGGGGSWYYGGGGGAGGLRSTVTTTGGGGSLESALSLSGSTAYTVTVGAGGSGGTIAAINGNGNDGSNSVFSTITSTGGGGGGGTDQNGRTGGSGGGSGGAGNAGGSGVPFGTAGTGTANQGYAGGRGWDRAGDGAAGGGGGAGAVGGAAALLDGGNGGNGVAVAITGSSITYAGGGGGSGYVGTIGTGGTGGGGSSVVGENGNNGTSNLGGGGGGASQDGKRGGNGGSGVVIVRYPV